MKKLEDEVSLDGKLERITMMELRKTPGDIMKAVELGKVCVVTRSGKEVAVLAKLPGRELSRFIAPSGDTMFRL